MEVTLSNLFNNGLIITSVGCDTTQYSDVFMIKSELEVS